MNKQNLFTGVFVLVFAILFGAGSAFATTPLSGWTSDFTSATNTAATMARPLVLFWANAGCTHCESLEEGVKSASFSAWRESSGYLFCFVLGRNGKDPDGTTIVRDFAGKAAGTAKKTPSNYPYVCLYWPKRHGDVEAVSFTTDSATTLINRADSFFAGYKFIPDYLGGDLEFTSEYANARLEAEVGFTKYVDVPLVRDVAASGFAATNVLSATFGGNVVQREVVAWGVDEATHSIRVWIPEGMVEGDEITVSLSDAIGRTRDCVRIFVVAPKDNSTKNPLFIGERTKDTLQYGEWTMDLDVAMEKYRQEPEARLLAVASGSLWCPDCVMTDEHVLETPAFKAWANEHKVILVDLDVPNFPNLTNSACLLTRVVGRTSDGYVSGRGTLATNEQERYQSGAGYLSRHMIPDSAAKSVLARNRELIGRNTLDGGWNNPDRANQNRTGIPNFFALTRDGEVAATFETFDAIGPSEFNAAYLSRFTELVELGANADGDFPNRSWQTTGDMFPGTGEVAATLSALDLVDAYALAATSDAAVAQTVTVRGEDVNTVVTVSLIEVANGTVKTIASVTGNLSDGVSATGVISSTGGDYYVSIAGAGSGTLAADSPAANTVTAYTLWGSRETIDNPFSNDWTAKNATTTIPLYGTDAVTLKGTLALSLKKSGKIAAKYSNGKTTVVTFTGKWNSDIAADGTATATMSKKGHALSLVMSADGVIAAEINDGTTSLASCDCGLSDDYGDFAGIYTVALQASESPVTSKPAGNAFMTLKMATTKTAKAKGTFNYGVYLPDGKVLTGSSNVTWIDANFGIVPVLRTTGANTFAATLKVRRNAGRAPSTRAVTAFDGTKATWTNTTGGMGFTSTFATFGSWYDRTDSLLAGIADEELRLQFLPDTSMVAASQKYGKLLAVAGDGAEIAVVDSKATAESITGFSFKINRTTGVVTGKTKLVFEGRSNVSATYKGILIRGWFSDCDCGEDVDGLIEMENVAFGLGYCLFSDRIGKKTAVRSFPVVIK